MRVARLRETERLEWRVLAALRPVHATSRVTELAPLEFSAPGARFARNRSGLHVLTRWQALAAHEAAFETPPSSPTTGSRSLVVTVRDPAGGYLPRRVSVALPRDPDPAAADSLFEPVVVPLYPAPSARLGANWSALRVHVAEDAGGDALGGALLRVVSGEDVLARGLTDWRGEALVPVAGVPVTTWAADPGPPGGGPPGGGPPGGGPPGGGPPGGGPPGDEVVVTSIDATLEAVFDPALGTRTPAAQVRAGRPPETLPLVDPDDLEARRGALPGAAVSVSLAARGSLSLNLALVLP